MTGEGSSVIVHATQFSYYSLGALDSLAKKN